MSGNDVTPDLKSSIGKRAPLDDSTRLELQKAALKTSVLAMFEDGARDGLRPASVRALRECLVTLGWLPTDIRL